MAIAVKCRCGKKFKAKDHLAGKAVRCPACKAPLRIPAGGADPSTAAGEERQTGSDSASQIAKTEAAILRVEQARKSKQLSAEEEAAYEQERRKLIESYDQLTGKKGFGKKAKKKGLQPDAKPGKPGIAAKFADACGTICSTLIFKYVFVVVLLSGGVVGSIVGVQCLAGYVQEEGGPQRPVDERIEDWFQEAEAAIEAGRWGQARDALGNVLRLNPRLEVNRRYRNLKKQLDEGFEKG